MAIAYVCAGLILGVLLSALILRDNRPDGYLRIDNSDSEGPYLFLELNKDVKCIAEQRTVKLVVRTEDFIPHK